MNYTSLAVCNPIEKHGFAPEGEFTQLSNALARDGNLSAEAFRVYALLLSHEDGYRESLRKIAERFGWGKSRAGKALRELATGRLLVIQPHLTERGTRAFETYHVHASGRFSDSDAERLARPVGESEAGPGGAPESDPVVYPNRTQGVYPNQTHKEHQTKQQENNNAERWVSNTDARATEATDDPWDGIGETE